MAFTVSSICANPLAWLTHLPYSDVEAIPMVAAKLSNIADTRPSLLWLAHREANRWQFKLMGPYCPVAKFYLIIEN